MSGLRILIKYRQYMRTGTGLTSGLGPVGQSVGLNVIEDTCFSLNVRGVSSSIRSTATTVPGTLLPRADSFPKASIFARIRIATSRSSCKDLTIANYETGEAIDHSHPRLVKHYIPGRANQHIDVAFA